MRLPTPAESRALAAAGFVASPTRFGRYDGADERGLSLAAALRRAVGDARRRAA